MIFFNILISYSLFEILKHPCLSTFSDLVTFSMSSSVLILGLGPRAVHKIAHKGMVVRIGGFPSCHLEIGISVVFLVGLLVVAVYAHVVAPGGMGADIEGEDVPVSTG